MYFENQVSMYMNEIKCSRFDILDICCVGIIISIFLLFTLLRFNEEDNFCQFIVNDMFQEGAKKPLKWDNVIYECSLYLIIFDTSLEFHNFKYSIEESATNPHFV